MPRKILPAAATPMQHGADRFAFDRRQFLETLALGAGVGVMLGSQGAAGADTPAVTASQPAPLKDVAGKTAYITAASDGIGLGIARALSNAGMKVVLGYRNQKRLEEALPLFKAGNAGVHAIKHDVTDRDGWQKLLEEIKGKFGNLHVLVNNAGVKTLKKASEAAAEEWDNAVAVNFTGIYNGVSAVLPHMKAHDEGGHIVTTASMGGLLPGSTAGIYTATKFAAVGLMEALRVELEATTIGTSVFCPGLVTTDNYPMGERAAPPPPADGRPPRPALQGMDPLEAGERVLNGIRNNDLFILSHPEFKAGMQERFDAILASLPNETAPDARVASERVVLHTAIYPREIAHRRQPRKNYRG